MARAERHTPPVAAAAATTVEREFMDAAVQCAFCDDGIEEDQPAVALRAGPADPAPTFVCMPCAYVADDEALRAAAR